jgi:hypothetical protein
VVSDDVGLATLGELAGRHGRPRTVGEDSPVGQPGAVGCRR